MIDRFTAADISSYYLTWLIINVSSLFKLINNLPNSINGGFPVAISTTVQPKDQMSLFILTNC